MPTATLRAVGRYRLETLIGRGGMAEVYRAVDSRLDRPVAVKMILPGLVSQRPVLERFLREARLVAGLEHPNILPIYDFGEEDGVPYLVMPLMTGGTLAERIGPAGLPPQTVADWVGQVAEALDTAHAAGILHRDVKPGNVLMDRKERPVLADFGLARSAGAASNLTRTGMMIGTPFFMAPELAQGGEASTGSDLYALGVLAYQMLSGTMPFHAATPVAVLHQHVVREVPPISRRIAGLPGEIDAFFVRALAKRPEDRFTSGAELARNLAACLGTTGSLASGPTVAPSAPDGAPSASAALLDGSITVTPVPDLQPAPAIPTPSRVASRRGWTLVFVLLFAALGMLLGARSLFHRAPHPVPPRAATEVRPIVPAPAVASLLAPRAAGRRPRHLGPSDFEALERRAAAGLAARPRDPGLSALAAFAAGGLAWSRGDELGAREAFERIESGTAGTEVAGSVTAWLSGGGPADDLADWELALLYGDARMDGVALVDEHLAGSPSDLRARTARALLLHLEGRHAEAAASARGLDRDIPVDEESAGHVLRFVGDELAELGAWRDALSAYRDAVRRGGSAVIPAGIEGGRIAAERLGDEDAARELYGAACAAGSEPACRRAEALDRAIGRDLPRRAGRR